MALLKYWSATLIFPKKGSSLFLNRGWAGHFPDLFDTTGQFLVHVIIDTRYSMRKDREIFAYIQY